MRLSAIAVAVIANARGEQFPASFPVIGSSIHRSASSSLSSITKIQRTNPPIMLRLTRSILPRRVLVTGIRPYSSSSSSSSSPFQQAPSPPKLSAEEQAEFERLQRAAALSPAFSSAATENKPPAADIATEGGLYRGAPPEFEGDKNPKTGEVGGPKREPLRWGATGDYSFNGKVTDF
ncbi:FMP21-like protein [Paramyrothecium foliicola]|nr:FMP21-like protein [Paramyrothecium foliicola]